MLLNLLRNTPHLTERTRCLSNSDAVGDGEFVLYWMHVAVRAHDNPSLDVAITLANLLKKPLLVYHALSEQYEYASDRHHTFILQGAADVQRQMADRGIPYVFHLERDGHRGPWLKQLANEACVTVTDDMPVQPMKSWVRRLAEGSYKPVLAVDSSCIVPMQVVGKAFTRAFAYRDATETEYEHRVPAVWTDCQLEHSEHPKTKLPFVPVDFRQSSIAELVAECHIDHLVGPVPDTPGGSDAGYRRWEDFREQGLKTYASRRNDPTKDGASRMSAYLHYGMVSPFRLAREADQHHSAGGRKFLDELLIWREMSWAFCFYSEHHEDLRALPGWARQTLQQHESDARPAIFDWESLSRAVTGNRLWDAAQQSLLIHGELHNNVRMTWGKAVLQWKATAAQALQTIIDLNHRYALDGRDPSSYGGILWCLGQFDRPFKPPQPVIGTVRPRPSEQHATRLDLRQYEAKIHRSLTGASSKRSRVAVIGAGMAGLICARTLQDHGLDVQVFDKGRQPAGRMSTRFSRTGFSFDHGCQYFKATDKHFKRYVESWQAQGIVGEWKAPVVRLAAGEVKPVKASTNRYVGIPGMNAVCQHLARDLNVQSNVRINQAEFDQRWVLHDDEANRFADFHHLVVAIPAGQALELLGRYWPGGELSASTQMKKSWTTLLAVDGVLDWPHAAAIIDDELLAWVALDSSKPGRSRNKQQQCWVLQAQPGWTDAHFEDPADEVSAALLARFESLIEESVPRPLYLKSHRWKFGLVENRSTQVPAAKQSLFDGPRSLVVCGDWCCGENVQAAFQSGSSAAGHILRSLEFTGLKPKTLF